MSIAARSRRGCDFRHRHDRSEIRGVKDAAANEALMKFATLSMTPWTSFRRSLRISIERRESGWRAGGACANVLHGVISGTMMAAGFIQAVSGILMDKTLVAATGSVVGVVGLFLPLLDWKHGLSHCNQTRGD